MLAEDIIPFITLYHWDTPQRIQEDGGWLDDKIVDHFADFARIAFEAFGDRVKWWLTFNEPHVFCLADWNYADKDIYKEEPPKRPYICAHNVVKAHAKAWRIYDEEYRSLQQGKMGITLNCDWSEPKNRSDPDHLEAMERSVNFRVSFTPQMKIVFFFKLTFLDFFSVVWMVGTSASLWRISTNHERTC